eukprot:scaffold299613_cov24-Tisochrysis_lutea.AAC.2
MENALFTNRRVLVQSRCRMMSPTHLHHEVAAKTPGVVFACLLCVCVRARDPFSSSPSRSLPRSLLPSLPPLLPAFSSRFRILNHLRLGMTASPHRAPCCRCHGHELRQANRGMLPPGPMPDPVHRQINMG